MGRAAHEPWFVYVLRCGDGSFYTGIARDVEARLAQHARGRGARYTRGRGPLSVVHVEPAGSRGDALRREAEIRRLGRAAKAAMASSTPSQGNGPVGAAGDLSETRRRIAPMAHGEEPRLRR